MGAFDGAWTHDLHITSQTCNPLHHAAPYNMTVNVEIYLVYVLLKQCLYGYTQIDTNHTGLNISISRILFYGPETFRVHIIDLLRH